jgi:hypothetical protein
MLGPLREEIIESQKARTDLLKWKLILVAFIGAAAFGIQGNSAAPIAGNNSAAPIAGNSAAPTWPPRILLLALVPFVCFYVDAVCIHNELRILNIARFIRQGGLGKVAADYEHDCKTHRREFSIESVALLGTTLLLSFVVLLVGGISWYFALPVPRLVSVVLGLSGGGGLFFSLCLECFVYAPKRDRLDDDEQGPARRPQGAAPALVVLAAETEPVPAEGGTGRGTEGAGFGGASGQT